MFQFLRSSDFDESLKKLDEPLQEAVKAKLQFLKSVENPIFFAKKLKGFRDKFRFRCGNYRIIFRLDGNLVALLTIKHRKEVYRDF